MSIVILLLTMASAPTPGSAEVKEAIARVKAIVNQPVTAIPIRPNTRVAVYPGWFHPGAIKPNFLHVDVRRTQEFPYARHEYVVSNLNPDVMFRGRDLEFNSMTKYFYTDRSVPKKRLTEEEMLEINRLYRIIARSEAQTARPKGPQAAAASILPVPMTSTVRAASLAGVLLLLAALWLHRRRSAGAR